MIMSSESLLNCRTLLTLSHLIYDSALLLIIIALIVQSYSTYSYFCFCSRIPLIMIIMLSTTPYSTNNIMFFAYF